MAVTERSRIAEMAKARDWCRWGPYLSERQWGTVREDYSADGDAWAYFRMIMPAPAPIAETRTASAAFATINSRFACRWRCGTGVIRSSRSGCSA